MVRRRCVLTVAALKALKTQSRRCHSLFANLRPQASGRLQANRDTVCYMRTWPTEAGSHDNPHLTAAIHRGAWGRSRVAIGGARASMAHTGCPHYLSDCGGGGDRGGSPRPLPARVPNFSPVRGVCVKE